MIFRAATVWFLLLVVAIANGVLRELLIVPHLGSQTGHVISTLILSAAIVAVAFLLVRWIDPADRSAALGVGGFWVALTLAFEFLAGHFLFGKPWPELLADYNLAAGRVWILVLVATLLAPAWAFSRMRPK